ncbi:prolyl oligopeptidase family serine peptidase [Actinoplanes sp. NBRC 101535]|uniref:S9 family peptidase n=1 Tax=Actinoplanes sp. NBRC 101535 TaxID=3032196 RepID=UPI0025539142|nr:prolyl oligopeptidase family serine peptidase [Actinoplanes sp. NBRC 101535]
MGTTVTSFPALYAQTQGFTLGAPHRFTVAPDGTTVLFLRSGGGTDTVGRLYAHDVATGEERLLADPAHLDAGDDTPMTDRERARRERARDRSAGIGGYSTDAAVTTAVFTVAGRLYAVDVRTAQVTGLNAQEPAAEARIDPTGQTVAYVSGDELRVVGRDGKEDRALATPDGPDITWGLPEHEASESMDRFEGHWWAPDGRSLIAARVDNTPVQIWYVSDPEHPERPPTALRYPSAGTPNAEVTLHILGLDGARIPVRWDAETFEYVTRVTWDDTALLVCVQNRPQTVMRVLAADPVSGETMLAAENTDPRWTTIVNGLPAHTAAGRLIWSVDDGDTRRLTVDGIPVTPPGLQVEEVLAVDGETVLFAARDEPAERHLWTVDTTSMSPVPSPVAEVPSSVPVPSPVAEVPSPAPAPVPVAGAPSPVRVTAAPGIHDGTRAGGVTVVVAHTLDSDTVTVDGRPLRSLAVEPPLRPQVRLAALGTRELRTAVLFPTGHVPGSAKLPVLLSPYGGSAAQRAVSGRAWYYAQQWFADQGFAVIVADGRGTPGRGPVWERARLDDHAGPRLQDQVDALHAAADRYGDMDLTRVGIRGWSAGGYLAALAVLRRPDVFHAAVAGAPVTDQLLYSSHWQERTLGLPHENPAGYAQGSLIADAPNLSRPLMLIHGLLDDNVLPVHTMKLSAALFAAGRPHTVLPLPGATHMGNTADRMWEMELAFLRNALTHPAAGPGVR